MREWVKKAEERLGEWENKAEERLREWVKKADERWAEGEEEVSRTDIGQGRYCRKTELTGKLVK